MQKFRRAFTLIELVITIALISVAGALSAIVISNLLNVQTLQSQSIEVENDLANVDEVIRKYVSIIAIESEELSFTDPVVQNDKNIVITNGSYTDSLSAVHSFKVTLIYTESNLRYSWEWEDNYNSMPDYENFCTPTGYYVKTIRNVNFEFDTALRLFIADIMTVSGTTRSVYVVRG